MCAVKYEGEYFEQHIVKKEEDDVKIKTETYDWENSNSSVELGTEENNATNMPVKLHQKLMRRKEEEHKEEMESLKKEHEQQLEIEAGKRRVAELEIEKLRAKAEVAEKEMDLKERKLQSANEKWEKEKSKYGEENMTLNKKLRESKSECENLTRENQELKNNHASQQKDSALLAEHLANAAAIVATRCSRDQSLSLSLPLPLPGGAEDELNNEPPAKKKCP